MDQNRTPLIDAIRNFTDNCEGYFCIPAHHMGRGADPSLLDLIGEKALRCDLTEAQGLDDLHCPEDAILEAEQLAAALFGSDRCWFLVNGTTCGNEAMILSSVRPGEKILIARNAHKSVMMGLILSGADPVWISPSYLGNWREDADLRSEDVEEALERDPAIRAVCLVSPTYYGICSDIRAIAHICHSRGIPLLVDEAHGSHLYFSEKFPEGAIAQGADLVVQSTHKTSGSMGQSSMLHLSGDLIDAERVDQSLKLVMSTSPSYVLMASLDGARHQLAVSGRDKMAAALLLADEFRRGLAAIPGISVLGPRESGLVLDPLRVVFGFADHRISGLELQQRLFERGHISTEIADSVKTGCVVTWGNTEEEVRHLVEVTGDIAGECPPATAEISDCIFRPEKLPRKAMTPREAWCAPGERISFAGSAGRIAKEAIIPYPPGIPLLIPGEILTEEIIRQCQEYRKSGWEFHGVADQSLATVSVVIRQ